MVSVMSDYHSVRFYPKNNIHYIEISRELNKEKNFRMAS